MCDGIIRKGRDYMGEMIVDTHTHYAHKRFDSGRDEIISRLPGAGIFAVIEAAIDYESNFKMKALCEKYPHVYMAAGCHPNCVEEMEDSKFRQIAELLNYDKNLAIGETGLDYDKGKTEEQIAAQKDWFRRFIELAIETQKPMVIHSRLANDELIEILKEYSLIKQPGVIHCFSGNVRQAKDLINMGFYLGVNGMFTKMDADADLCIALKQIPLERILLETDAPYLAPAGAEGKRNTSMNLSLIVEQLSELRGESSEYIRKVVLENTRKMYPFIFEK